MHCLYKLRSNFNSQTSSIDRASSGEISSLHVDSAGSLVDVVSVVQPEDPGGQSDEPADEKEPGEADAPKGYPVLDQSEEESLDAEAVFLPEGGSRSTQSSCEGAHVEEKDQGDLWCCDNEILVWHLF